MTTAFTRRAALGAAALALPALLSRPARSAAATIDVIHSWSGADHPFQRLVRTYNDRKTGVTVIPRQEGTTYEAITQKAMAGITAGRPPVLMTTGWKLADFARRTLGARDLRATFGPERFAALADNVRPQVMGIVTVDGANAGLPFAMSTPLLYVNMDLWRKAGLDPDTIPDTVEALYPAIRTLQERTGKGGLACLADFQSTDIGAFCDRWDGASKCGIGLTEIAKRSGGSIRPLATSKAGPRLATVSPEAV